jgi:CP family cyanate transporter-like MFS transporter
MVQGVGYGVGAVGPLLVGVLHGWTGGFGGVGALFLLVGALAIYVGMRAGRAKYVKGVAADRSVPGEAMYERKI